MHSSTDCSGGALTCAWGAKATNRHTRVVPTIIFHGDADLVVHPCNGDALAAQALRPTLGVRQKTEHGRTPGWYAYVRVIYADPKGRTMCEQWRSRGAGHASAAAADPALTPIRTVPTHQEKSCGFSPNIGGAGDLASSYDARESRTVFSEQY